MIPTHDDTPHLLGPEGDVFLPLRCLFLATCCLAWVASVDFANAQEKIGPQADYAEIAERVRAAIVEQLEDKQLPAVSIALIDDQQIVWAEGFGNQDPERGVPATAETVYRVGSVSKLFTDIAVMQLVEEELLGLDEDIRTYLPNFQVKDSFDEPITTRQLMSHRAGIIREPPVGNYFDPDEPTLEATVASLSETYAIHPPAERTKYSNAGVAVVGYLLEVLDKEIFEDAILRRVLEPLGMSNSDYRLTDRLRDRLAQAQMWTHDGRRFDAPVFKLGTAPAGNLYSDVIDLGKFCMALFAGGQGERGRILQEATLRGMIDPQFADRQGGDYGLGFRLSELDGHPMIGHGGAVYGYSTQFHALPEQKLGVVVVTSLDGANTVMRRLAMYTLRSVLAAREDREPPSWVTTTAIPAERARALDGRYVITDKDRSIRLIERNGQLYKFDGRIRVRLRQDGEALVVDDIHQFGLAMEPLGPNRIRVGDIEFTRSDDTLPPEIDASWLGLVGEYGWDHNTLFVFEHEGQLHCLIEWFFYYPLTPAGDDSFAFPNYGLYPSEFLKFERDESGKAISAALSSGGEMAVVFQRRSLQAEDGSTFRIDPVAPIDEIRTGALEARPPEEQGSFAATRLVELTELDDSIRLDIRYATTNNFMGSKFYREPRAFLQRPAAEAVVRAHRKLKERGYGLLIHDAYRPWFVTKMFWDATPEDLKIFVANPANGSRHNRGCAVDLTLFDLRTGQPIDMGAGYDEFSPRSFPDYEVRDSRARWHRELLRDVMESEGFTIYEYEWWHFDYRGWEAFPIENLRFEEIR